MWKTIDRIPSRLNILRAYSVNFLFVAIRSLYAFIIVMKGNRPEKIISTIK